MTQPLSRRLFLSLAGAAVVLRAHPAEAIATRPDTVVIWQGEGAHFGGFSALELSSDRTRMLTISDRGFAVRARLHRDASGRLTSIEPIEQFALRDRDGTALTGGRADVEGMDQRPDGSLFLSFEGGRRTRVMRQPSDRAPAEPLPRHPDWANLRGNGGLEALAVDATGAVFTIPESPVDGRFPIYRFDGRAWSVVAQLRAQGGFAPVGADFGPDGNLYLLERNFRLAFFATRISRLRPQGLGVREVLVETGYGVLDNHEGISITRDAAGQLWATTISDDNQNRFQRTELAEFALPDA
ncbi:esterase-like activity of phytase family protein [Pararhodobacter sp.]|uniref:esterase-like activity of phytase family protein n=1 Tax=Pararhodobacter sp. TaxID=2127056 RepID=UPI002AFF0293|nr:esterase-like activity of phytase family protein [Pararhodobacter sp.]